jgi:hypothetical protein
LHNASSESTSATKKKAQVSPAFAVGRDILLSHRIAALAA